MHTGHPLADPMKLVRFGRRGRGGPHIHLEGDGWSLVSPTVAPTEMAHCPSLYDGAPLPGLLGRYFYPHDICFVSDTCMWSDVLAEEHQRMAWQQQQQQAIISHEAVSHEATCLTVFDDDDSCKQSDDDEEEHSASEGCEDDEEEDEPTTHLDDEDHSASEGSEAEDDAAVASS